jgi:hypothetical protein
MTTNSVIIVASTVFSRIFQSNIVQCRSENDSEFAIAKFA